jgi:cation:H+ antiporter
VNALREIGVEILTGRGLALPAVAFVVVGCLVFVAASRLAERADEIADATGLGRVWIGSVLLAASTSLPELTTDVNAAMLGAIDSGVGDLFGSTLANMLVLATLDSVLIAAMYLFGMHAVYRSIGVPSSPPAQLELGATRKGLLLRGLRGFAFGTIGLLVAAPLLVVTAEAIALESGQTQTMVGTALVGFTTSFPEIAATIAAARTGAFDLAVGNIFGSNAFNVCIFLAMDVAYSGAPVLSVASLDHVLTGQIAVLTIALGVMGILARAQRRIAVVRVESLLVVAADVGAVWLLMTPAGAR